MVTSNHPLIPTKVCNLFEWNAKHWHDSPSLLHLVLGPIMAAFMCCDVVGFLVANKWREDWVWGHDEERYSPSHSDNLVCMGSSLPGPGLQRITDSTVSLDCYGHKTEGGYANRNSCGRQQHIYISNRKHRICMNLGSLRCLNTWFTDDSFTLAHNHTDTLDCV